MRRSRKKHTVFNLENGITLEGAKRQIKDILASPFEHADRFTGDVGAVEDYKPFLGSNFQATLRDPEAKMRAAAELNFEMIRSPSAASCSQSASPTALTRCQNGPWQSLKPFKTIDSGNVQILTDDSQLPECCPSVAKHGQFVATTRQSWRWTVIGALLEIAISQTTHMARIHPSETAWRPVGPPPPRLGRRSDPVAHPFGRSRVF